MTEEPQTLFQAVTECINYVKYSSLGGRPCKVMWWYGGRTHGATIPL